MTTDRTPAPDAWAARPDSSGRDDAVAAGSVSLDPDRPSPPPPGRAGRGPSRRSLLLGGLVAVGVGAGAARWAPNPLGSPKPPGPTDATLTSRSTDGPQPLSFSPPIGNAYGHPPSAVVVLDTMAGAVLETPDELGSGRYGYIELQVWTDPAMPTSARPGGGPVQPLIKRSWRASDSSLLISTVGSVDEPAGAATPVLSPGSALESWPPHPLSTDPDVLAAQLTTQPGGGTVPLSLPLLDRLFRSEPLHPPVRAAALRLLARVEGLSVLGSGPDRRGRPGVAFTVDGDQAGIAVQRILILDPVGRPLGSEVLTRPRGAVWSSTVWLAAKMTDTLS